MLCAGGVRSGVVFEVVGRRQVLRVDLRAECRAGGRDPRDRLTGDRRRRGARREFHDRRRRRAAPAEFLLGVQPHEVQRAGLQARERLRDRYRAHGGSHPARGGLDPFDLVRAVFKLPRRFQTIRRSLIRVDRAMQRHFARGGTGHRFDHRRGRDDCAQHKHTIIRRGREIHPPPEDPTAKPLAAGSAAPSP